MRAGGSGPVLGDGAGGMRQTHLGQYAMLGEARGEGVEVLQGLLFPRVLAWQQGEGAAVGRKKMRTGCTCDREARLRRRVTGDVMVRVR